MFNRTFLVRASLALILVFLFFPFRVTVAPEWNVKVVDQHGDPVKDAYVQEFATNWTLDFRHNEAVCSDKDGTAQFPKRSVRASYMTRILETVSKIGPHSSLGHDVKIAVEGLGYGDMTIDSGWIKWNGYADQVNSSLTVLKCPEGLTGYQCAFDYEYFFDVNSSAKRMQLCESSPGRRFDPM